AKGKGAVVTDEMRKARQAAKAKRAALSERAAKGKGAVVTEKVPQAQVAPITTDLPLAQNKFLDQDGMRARKFKTARTMFALMLREMSATYGSSPGGYLWVVLEPALALAMLSYVFSFFLKTPPFGDSFPLFYATGYLPFVLFIDISNKTATSLKFSRQLLQYPAVTFVDAMIARGFLHFLTHLSTSYIVFIGMVVILKLNLTPDYVAVAKGFFIGGVSAFGLGCLNCYVMMTFVAWERIWQILTRPLLFVSGVLIPFDSMPLFAQDILWWNPIVHVVGYLRKGMYAPMYEGDYLSVLYPVFFGLLLMAFGLLFLLRNNQKLLEGL
ncbi:ABC transporter permease, partial [Pacificibacter sp.]|uniref:ABC transporter permease n=1 Tax=Pacificibacter sp. TaxID=1917866 RepID=UPI00321BEBB4